MHFSFRQHAFIALQGTLLFSLNYLFVYLAEIYLTSGLVAIVFSMLVFMNIIAGGVFLGTPVRLFVVLGAAVGMVGIVLVFLPELNTYGWNDSSMVGLLLSFLGTVSASLGNIAAARNQQHGLPVLQTNAFGMGYGAVLMYIYALLSGVPFRFDVTPTYIGSLLYLAIFGSILAFGAYLTLLGNIGADRAAYGSLLYPLIALWLSTLFEGYRWSGAALFGVVLVLSGNIIVLVRKHGIHSDKKVIKDHKDMPHLGS